MKIIACIPIKLHNERMPGKNIKAFFDGTPLMHLIQHTCLEVKALNEIYIYCSDETVKDYIVPPVRFLKRPKHLDENNSNFNEIIHEFVNAVPADIYVYAHATAPFTTVQSIDECIAAVASGKYDSAFMAVSLKKYLWQDGKPLNFDPKNFPRTQDLPPVLQETSGAYVFTRSSFQEHGYRIGEKAHIREIGTIEAMDIDYPEDFDVANLVYKEIVLNASIKKRGKQ
jgi:CMP-N-acetylneuraminic acid synthetase